MYTAVLCLCLYRLSLYGVLTTTHQISVVRWYSTEYIVPVKSSVHVQFRKNFSDFSIYWALKYPVILLWHKFFMALSFNSFWTSMTLSISSTVVFLLHSKYWTSTVIAVHHKVMVVVEGPVLPLLLPLHSSFIRLVCLHNFFIWHFLFGGFSSVNVYVLSSRQKTGSSWKFQKDGMDIRWLSWSCKWYILVD